MRNRWTWAPLLTGFALALATAPLAAQQSPYTELQSRAIKALSVEQIEQYQRGEGMGLALAAELNGYPGPRHVLELATTLGLSVRQSAAVKAAFDAMQLEAVALGQSIVELERRLDRLFAAGEISAAALSATLDELGGLQARLRYAHLNAHLETKRALTAEQVATYAQLRGYSGHTHDPQRHHN